MHLLKNRCSENWLYRWTPNIRVMMKSAMKAKFCFLPAHSLIHNWLLRRTQIPTPNTAWVQIANDSTPRLISSSRNQCRKIFSRPSRFAKKGTTLAKCKKKFNRTLFPWVRSPSIGVKVKIVSGVHVCWEPGWPSAFLRYQILCGRRGWM